MTFFFLRQHEYVKAVRTHTCAFTNLCESVRDNTGLVLSVLSCGQSLLCYLYFYIWLQPWNGHPTLSLIRSKHLIKTHFCEWNYLECIQRWAHVVFGASLQSLPCFIWPGSAPVLINIGLKLFTHYSGCHGLNASQTLWWVYLGSGRGRYIYVTKEKCLYSLFPPYCTTSSYAEMDGCCFTAN